jgi:hypothetical protein
VYWVEAPFQSHKLQNKENLQQSKKETNSDIFFILNHAYLKFTTKQRTGYSNTTGLNINLLFSPNVINLFKVNRN